MPRDSFRKWHSPNAFLYFRRLDEGQGLCIISCLGVKVPHMAICCLVFWVCTDNRPLWTHWCPVCCSVKAPRLFDPGGHRVDLKHHGWWALIWPPQQTQAFLCNLQTVKHNFTEVARGWKNHVVNRQTGGGVSGCTWREREKKPKNSQHLHAVMRSHDSLLWW